MAAKAYLPWLVVVITTAIGGGIAAAVGFGNPGPELFGLPLMLATAIYIYALQWLVFIPAYVYQTERYYDLTGSITYITTVILIVTVGGQSDDRSVLLAGLILIWAGRLGTFLFRRITADGGDNRFDRLKPVFGRFLQVWTLQGLWVFLTASCALAAMTSGQDRALGPVAFLGLAMWLAGFGIEVISDRQKSAFRADPANKGRFINTGLWAWSKHPNYFGEILLWTGIAVIAVPVLTGWAWLTLISPVFVYLLLSRVSGVPLLEKRADEEWGDDPEYIRYRDNTPALMLRPPRKAS